MTDMDGEARLRPLRERVVQGIVGPPPTSRRRSRFDRISSPHVDSSTPEAIGGLTVSVVFLLVVARAILLWESPLWHLAGVLASMIGVLVVI